MSKNEEWMKEYEWLPLDKGYWDSIIQMYVSNRSLILITYLNLK
jgi:hypothetical protein